MTPPKPGRMALGQAGEEAAARHLESKGYRLVARRYRTRMGEIDLVARDGDVLVFIEVKTRSATGFGRPEEAVGFLKQARLSRLASLFLAAHPALAREGADCRFDVVSVLWRGGERPVVDHIEDAFRPGA